jgi:uncharacterized protein involved in exopolysaccharide biosynthesis
MNTLYYEPDQSLWSLDLRSLLKLVSSRRWVVVICVVLSTSAFTTLAFILKPVYESTVVLVPANTERSLEGIGGALGQLGGIASLAGLSMGARGNETEEALAVLRSRHFTESFINDHNLMPVLFAGKWDAAQGRWKVPLEDQPTPARAFRFFDRKIRSVVQDKKTGLVTLSVDWRNRELAAAWANELAQRLNEEMRARAIGKAESSLGYLEHELEATTTVPTREAIGRLIEAQVKQRMVAHVTQEYAFRVVDKAMVADKDDPIRPNRPAIIAVGFLAGLAAALGWIMLSYSLNPGRFSVPRPIDRGN